MEEKDELDDESKGYQSSEETNGNAKYIIFELF